MVVHAFEVKFDVRNLLPSGEVLRGIFRSRIRGLCRRQHRGHRRFRTCDYLKQVYRVEWYKEARRGGKCRTAELPS